MFVITLAVESDAYRGGIDEIRISRGAVEDMMRCDIVSGTCFVIR